MELAGAEGNELGLSLVGYQFPDEAVDPWDSNGLLVAVRVVSPHGTWEVVDPCLTTWEAASLASWLAAVALSPKRPPPPVAAPNITVRARPAGPGRVGLRWTFELEERPPWVRGAAGADDLNVDLDVTASDVMTAARALRADLARFPQRGDDPTL